MSEYIENTKDDINSDKQSFSSKNFGSFYISIIPILVLIYFAFGFLLLEPEEKKLKTFYEDYKEEDENLPTIDIAALLTPDQFSANLRDTVYTNDDLYLELRIDRQKLYVHYRDGRVKELLVSTGLKYASKSVESRPGIFAIFLKEEVHLSSQFNNAKMFHYMPFNMGIGFHGLAGTGYYSNLGVRPSSHGCIRMRNDDVKQLFKECKIGTLVLAHYGKSARVIAFAPEDFTNDRAYTKDDYMKMLAYNLNSIYTGQYFLKKPKKFILDGSVIPRIGFNVGNSDDIPQKQNFPFFVKRFELVSDKISQNKNLNKNIAENLDSELVNHFSVFELNDTLSKSNIDVSQELVDKLAYNKVGILPYFPPNR